MQTARRELGGASSLLYMRHGERQDMADSNWVNTAPRPWDPPLSSFGLKQAAQRGCDLLDSGIAITAVVSSPFTRCIQTAVEVLHLMLSVLALTKLCHLLAGFSMICWQPNACIHVPQSPEERRCHGMITRTVLRVDVIGAHSCSGHESLRTTCISSDSGCEGV
jgi:Histidine phosphatase superfamily (branch 1)